MSNPSYPSDDVPADTGSAAVTGDSGSAPGVPGGSATPAEPAPGFDSRGRVRNTRTSGVWIGLIATAVFLVLLIVFIAQNSRSVSIHFLGWHGRFSLALTILLSAVIGILLVAIPGTVRILQLRRALRRNAPVRG
ncbi:MAG TPA: lipopolysaccharide assembly protein LapA domain-containing protein [Jatrophihabitans sp.]|nr:lipopolysaccharide assembly protein LapA domain-containing protein [Jatrophihabitans sp.]